MAAPIFMGAWEHCVLSAGKPHAHKIPRFRRGGGILVFLGGRGKCRCYVYGREDFSDNRMISDCDFPRVRF